MTGFDELADSYDQTFTNTLIGQIQRRQVYNHLEKSLKNSEQLKVLEINCGTGVDAVWFASHGYDVIATDASEKMIKIANQRAEVESFSKRISFQQVDIRDLNKLNQSGFDLIFSNFSGLNCIEPDEIDDFASNAQQLMTDEGKLIVVLFAKFCLAETILALLKFNFSLAFRRFKFKVEFKLDNSSMNLFYYSIKQFRQLLLAQFKLKRSRAVGVLTPPSYLAERTDRFPLLMKLIEKIDQLFISLPLTQYISDHVYLEFNKTGINR